MIEKTLFSELETGKGFDIRVLVTKVENALSSQNVNFQKVSARDAGGNKAILYNWTGEQLPWKPPVILKTTIELQEVNGYPKMIQFGKEDSARIADFLPKPSIDIGHYWKKFVEYDKSLRSSLRILVGKIITPYKEKFTLIPLHSNGTFSETGGVLEATIKLANIADAVARTMPELDRDLLVAGALLYYIGNINTLNEIFDPTEDEVLFGKGIAAANIITETVSAMDEKTRSKINMQEVKVLCHIIISKFGNKTDAKAAVPEAVWLRYLDSAMKQAGDISLALADAEPGSIVKNKYFKGENYELQA